MTARERLKLLAGSLVAALPIAPVRASAPGRGSNAQGQGSTVAQFDGADPAGTAWRELAATVEECGRFIQSHPFYASAENRSLAFSMMVGTLITNLETNFIFDQDFPNFAAHDNRIRRGVDNPDQRYSGCKIRGGVDYRIWGHTGSATRIEFQTYAGDPFAPGGGGVPSAMMFEEVTIAPDGTFEVFLTPEKRGANWLANPPSTTQLIVRATYAEWSSDLPAELHIDRLGMEGALRPLISEDEAARRLRNTAKELMMQTQLFPTFVPMMFGSPDNPVSPQDLPGNVMAPIQDVESRGGAKGRVMAFGTWDLEPDEALVLRITPLGAPYQGVALSDVWGSALEYANRQSCLSNEQAALSADGTYTYVIAGRDPGVANWLDTMGLRQGQICIRIDGKRTKPLDPDNLASLKKVKLADIAEHLPSDMPRISPAERATVIASRRKHVQVRSHN